MGAETGTGLDVSGRGHSIGNISHAGGILYLIFNLVQPIDYKKCLLQVSCIRIVPYWKNILSCLIM